MAGDDCSKSSAEPKLKHRLYSVDGDVDQLQKFEEEFMSSRNRFSETEQNLRGQLKESQDENTKLLTANEQLLKEKDELIEQRDNHQRHHMENKQWAESLNNNNKETKAENRELKTSLENEKSNVLKLEKDYASLLREKQVAEERLSKTERISEMNLKLLTKSQADVDELRSQLREKSQRVDELILLIANLHQKLERASLFYEDLKGAAKNKPLFPNIETSPREREEMNTYIDKELLRMGRALADKPFALANSYEMDAAYTSSLSGVVQYPPGIIRYADSTGVKPSEAFNAHRMANNAATGANKPLLTPSPVTDLIDGAPPAMRKLFMSDVDAQVRRGGAMLTGQLPRRSSTGTQRQALQNAAAELGVDPIDLATIIGFETGGTYDPGIVGGQGGNYQGLIQFGIPERQAYGVVPGMTFEEQLLGPVVRYFKDRFAKVGMSTQGATLEDLYTTVLAGNPKANRDARDSFGTSARSGAARMFKEHRPAAIKRFGF